MAEAAVDSNMDCLLCSEECGQPVTLGCEHRFCCRCLREHWAPSDSGDCPTCKRRSSKGLPCNFASEKRDLSEELTESSGEKEKEKKLPKQPVESPTEEPGESGGAASGGEQQFYVKLKEKKERTEEMIKQYKSMLEHTERQAQDCDDQIRAQFDLFHQFIVKEEESQLSALRKEHQEKTQIIEEELRKQEEKLSSLSDSVRSAEQQLQGQSSSLSELMESLVLTDEPEPQLRSGLLIDQAGVLGNLGFKVWRKMRTIVNYSPVILDPNTAHRDLRLSEDLTSVRHEDTQQLVPLNPERFTNYTSVLGSEGAISGRYWWEVEVGDHPHWVVGVANESVNRRARCDALPKDGFWCLMYRNNKYSDVVGNTVKLRRRPEKICIDLDCDTGTVSFYDGSDMTLICSHRDTFTEKVYPYYSVGKAGDGNVTKDIKIRPYNLSISLEPRAQTFQMPQRVPISSPQSGSVPKQKPVTTTKEASLQSQSDPKPESGTKEKTPEVSLSRKFKMFSSQKSSSRPETSGSTKKKPVSFLQRRKQEHQTEPSERTEEN